MISIVTTWFRAHETLETFHRRVREVAGAECELIWVFDGTLAPQTGAFREDPNLRVIELPEHQGEGAARLAGIRVARGEEIFLIPGDLDIAPESLPRFRAALTAEVDVVIGCQSHRRGGVAERVSGEVFYLLYNRVARQAIPPNPAGCYLFRAEAARRVQPAVLFVSGVLSAGLRARVLLVDKTRQGGSGYRWRDRWRLALRALAAG